MQEEIFGPVLPVLAYDSLDEAIEKVNSMAHPLALYIFTSDKEAAEKVTSHCGFGGGCVNDTIIHLATSEMGFGGFGESGMGSYHGKDGFHTFSHYKSIVDKKTFPASGYPTEHSGWHTPEAPPAIAVPDLPGYLFYSEAYVPDLPRNPWQ